MELGAVFQPWILMRAQFGLLTRIAATEIGSACARMKSGRVHVYQAAADIFSLTTRRQFFQTPRKL
jgi:hypothetical protein